jgi:hypothetical protein
MREPALKPFAWTLGGTGCDIFPALMNHQKLPHQHPRVPSCLYLAAGGGESMAAPPSILLLTYSLVWSRQAGEKENEPSRSGPRPQRDFSSRGGLIVSHSSLHLDAEPPGDLHQTTCRVRQLPCRFFFGCTETVSRVWASVPSARPHTRSITDIPRDRLFYGTEVATRTAM